MTNYRSLGDLELAALVRSDDQAAFTEIYHRFGGTLLQAAYNRLRDKEQCRDIVQNVFASFWDRRAQTEILNISAYLHNAVRFQVINAASRHPNPSLFTDSFDALSNKPVANEDKLLEKEILQLFELFIAALPAKRREIFIRRYQNDESTAEIAAALNISRKTVQNQLKTTEDALRGHFAHFVTIATITSFFLR